MTTTSLLSADARGTGEALEDSGREVIAHAHAKTIASYWLDQDRPDAPLTVMTLTGAIADETADVLEHDLRALELATAHEVDAPVMAQAQLTALLDYVQGYGVRGPVPGWSELPDDDPWSRSLIPLRPTDPEPVEHHAPPPGYGSDSSAYDRIGGGRGVGEIVETLYRTVLADPALAPYFDGIDISRVKAHQYSFLNHATGGPDYYAGRSLQRSHSGLGITHEHFERLIAHLIGSLEGRAIDQHEIDAIVSRVAYYRDEIVHAD